MKLAISIVTAISLGPSCTAPADNYDTLAADSLREAAALRFATAPENGKGITIVYWKPSFAPAAPKFRLYANDQLSTPKMQHGAFFAHDADPGLLRLAATAAAARPKMKRVQ